MVEAVDEVAGAGAGAGVGPIGDEDAAADPAMPDHTTRLRKRCYLITSGGLALATILYVVVVAIIVRAMMQCVKLEIV